MNSPPSRDSGSPEGTVVAAKWASRPTTSCGAREATTNPAPTAPPEPEQPGQARSSGHASLLPSSNSTSPETWRQRRGHGYGALNFATIARQRGQRWSSAPFAQLHAAPWSGQCPLTKNIWSESNIRWIAFYRKKSHFSTFLQVNHGHHLIHSYRTWKLGQNTMVGIRRQQTSDRSHPTEQPPPS